MTEIELINRPCHISCDLVKPFGVYVDHVRVADYDSAEKAMRHLHDLRRRLQVGAEPESAPTAFGA